MSETDGASTLGELERKLRELEEELQAPAPTPAARPDGASPTAAWRTAAAPDPRTLTPAAEAPTPHAESPTAAVAPSDPAAPASSVSAQEQLDVLIRFRDELERSTRQLMAEYDRVLGSLGSPVSVGVPPPPRTSEAATPGPWRPAPAALARKLDDVVLDGAITVDAGPFTNIAALSGFEQALAAVPGVREVHVRSFEGAAAIVDVTLARPVALGSELRRRSPVSCTVTAAHVGRLSLAVDQS